MDSSASFLPRFTTFCESISLNQMKGNAVLTIGTGIVLALLAYQKATRVLWGAG